MKKTNHKKVGKEIWFYARVILIVLVLLFPFIIMLSISFKATAETIGYPPTIIPRDWEIQHFIDIFNENVFPFMKYMKNSLYSIIDNITADCYYVWLQPAFDQKRKH